MVLAEGRDLQGLVEPTRYIWALDPGSNRWGAADLKWGWWKEKLENLFNPTDTGGLRASGGPPESLPGEVFQPWFHGEDLHLPAGLGVSGNSPEGAGGGSSAPVTWL